MLCLFSRSYRKWFVKASRNTGWDETGKCFNKENTGNSIDQNKSECWISFELDHKELLI